MDDYLERSLRVTVQLASALDMDEPRIGNYIHTTPERVAVALADFAYLRRPTTPQAIEMLCEIVLLMQDHPVTRDPGPRHIIGGTDETGWPIDPVERLSDCIIAAADLGMFDAVHPLPSDQRTPDLPFPLDRRWGDQAAPPQRTDGKWPIIETLPDGSQSEFSPIGGQWITTRHFAYIRSQVSRSGPQLSVHAQFLWDLDQLLSLIVDRLIDMIQQHT